MKIEKIPADIFKINLFLFLLFLFYFWFWKYINGLQSFEIIAKDNTSFSKNDISEATSTIWNWKPKISSNNKNFKNSAITMRRCKGGFVCNNEQCDFRNISGGTANFVRFSDEFCDVSIWNINIYIINIITV